MYTTFLPYTTLRHQSRSHQHMATNIGKFDEFVGGRWLISDYRQYFTSFGKIVGCIEWNHGDLMSVGSSAGGFNQYVLPNSMNLDIDEQDWLAQINQDYIPLSYTTSHSHWILIKIIYKYRYDTGKCSSLLSTTRRGSVHDYSNAHSVYHFSMMSVGQANSSWIISFIIRSVGQAWSVDFILSVKSLTTWQEGSEKENELVLCQQL